MYPQGSGKGERYPGGATGDDDQMQEDSTGPAQPTTAASAAAAIAEVERLYHGFQAEAAAAAAAVAARSSASSSASSSSSSSSSSSVPMAMAAPAAAAGVPTLTTIPPTDAQTQENPGGGFSYTRQWVVGNTDQGGVIIQRVTREYTVFRYQQTGAHTFVLDTTNAHSLADLTWVNASRELRPDVAQYWEAWIVTVDASGAITVQRNEDTFMQGAITPGRAWRNTSRGTCVIRGTATFYKGVTRAQLEAVGFAVRPEHPASTAHSMDAEPDYDALGAVARSAPHTITYTAEWDTGENSDGYTTYTAAS